MSDDHSPKGADLKFPSNGGDNDPTERGFEGLKFWRDGPTLLIEASYDMGYASIWVELDADEVQQLRDLLA